MNAIEDKLISALRSIMPKRAVNIGEAYQLAEVQADRLLHLLDIKEAAVDISRICDLPSIDVEVEPRHKMPQLAGFTTQQDGRWLIKVNENETLGERRHTLAHEFKHILDDPIYTVAYGRLGFGDKQRHYQAVESVCDHFAACVLMPRAIIKKVWLSGIREPEALADFFEVSEESVVQRLNYLGLEGDKKPIKQYFRHILVDLWITKMSEVVSVYS